MKANDDWKELVKIAHEAINASIKDDFEAEGDAKEIDLETFENALKESFAKSLTEMVNEISKNHDKVLFRDCNSDFAVNSAKYLEERAHKSIKKLTPDEVKELQDDICSIRERLNLDKNKDKPKLLMKYDTGKIIVPKESADKFEKLLKYFDVKYRRRK
jgi:hypothetical protein